MSEDKEPFLERWSRLKRERAEVREHAEVPADAKSDEPAAPLPPLEELTPESDFSAFMGPKVADALRRAALKKLFAHPEINVADPFEPFSGDWTIGEPIPEEMLARLHEARAALRRKPDAQAEAPTADAAQDEPPAPEEEQERQEQQEQQEQRTRSEGVPGRQDA
jgi:hypothetical protein